MLRRTFIGAFVAVAATWACGEKPRVRRRIIVVSSTPSGSAPTSASPPNVMTSAGGSSASVPASAPSTPICTRTAYDVVAAEFSGRTRYEHQVTSTADGNRVFIDEDPNFEVIVNGSNMLGAPDLTSRVVCPGDQIEVVRYL